MAGLGSFEGRASLRTWLYRIATNQCLNALRSARRRRAPEPEPPFDPPEPTRRAQTTWLQPYPDTLLDQIQDEAPGPEARYRSKEAVELAFITALQLLPPRQAAAFVLRDVLGYAAGEVADMLGTTETAIKGILQRARASLDRHRAGADNERRPPPGSPREQDLTRRFGDAFAAGDVDRIITLLTDDAWLAMPPAPHEYHGPTAVAAFLRASSTWRGGTRPVLVPTRANTQPAFGCYLAEARQRTGHAAGLLVLTITHDPVSAITRFLDSNVFRYFGLPETISVEL